MRSKVLYSALAVICPIIAQAQLSLSPQFSGMVVPVGFVQPSGEQNRAFVVELRFAGATSTGRVSMSKRVNGVWGLRQTFLSVPNLATGGEQGLLGLAFHPNFATNRQFFVNCTNATGATEIRRYTASLANPDVADTTFTTILTIPQPYANHNGGCIKFGPDGYLYIGMGDGGLGGDPGNRALDVNSLLGKMLRIDVDKDDFPADPAKQYGIPSDNPYVGITGNDEIWAMGLRNPWRFAFDRNDFNGFESLTIADVGESTIEEVNHVAPGLANVNYGWRAKEGTLTTVWPGIPGVPTPTDPIFQYTHDIGVSITGGEIYRGWELGPEYYGQYFCADFNNGWMMTVPLNQNTDTGAATSAIGAGPFNTLPFLPINLSLPTINMDNSGELWAMEFGSNGKASRIIRTFPSGVQARKIEGTINLQDLAAGSEPLGLTINLDVIGSGSPTSDYAFAMALKPDQTYRVPSLNVNGRLWIKYGTFLRKVLPANAIAGNLTNINFSLINGDVDQDGEIGPSDFDSVVASFGASGVNSADIDKDGEVGPSDFDIVVANFGLGDDPL